jgi:hypothetical protein
MEILDLITGALRDVGIIDSTRAPSAEQGSNALRNLNQLMASLEEDGIDLGYAPTTAITDEILIPLGMQRTIQALLAVKEASDRGIQPTETILSIAARGYNRMLSQAVAMQVRSAQSNTLPAGSGQVAWADFYTG